MLGYAAPHGGGGGDPGRLLQPRRAVPAPRDLGDAQGAIKNAVLPPSFNEADVSDKPSTGRRPCRR